MSRPNFKDEGLAQTKKDKYIKEGNDNFLKMRQWANIILSLEVVWLALYTGCIFSVEILTETHPGEPYRLTVALAAFHLVALTPSILFTLSDCSAWVLICFVGTILTDVLNLMRISIHVSDVDYYWARVLLFVLACSALFISVVAFIWRLVVAYHKICFKETRKRIQ